MYYEQYVMALLLVPDMDNVIKAECATGEDKAVAYEQFEALKLGKQWHKFIDADTAVDFIFEKNAENTFIVNDTYLVSYLLLPLWCSKDSTVVQELVVAKLYDNGGTLKDVVEFLRQEATAFNAAGVIVGTSLTNQDEALERRYQNAGMSAVGRVLFIES